MRTISEEVSLAGKLDTITITELRKRPGEVIASVKLGKTFLLTSQGKVVAMMSKPPGITLTIVANADGSTGYKL